MKTPSNQCDMREQYFVATQSPVSGGGLHPASAQGGSSVSLGRPSNAKGGRSNQRAAEKLPSTLSVRSGAPRENARCSCIPNLWARICPCRNVDKLAVSRSTMPPAQSPDSEGIRKRLPPCKSWPQLVPLSYDFAATISCRRHSAGAPTAKL
jgi:hypothetical protein